jgi:hypothetical protein
MLELHRFLWVAFLAALAACVPMAQAQTLNVVTEAPSGGFPAYRLSGLTAGHHLDIRCDKQRPIALQVDDDSYNYFTSGWTNDAAEPRPNNLRIVTAASGTAVYRVVVFVTAGGASADCVFITKTAGDVVNLTSAVVSPSVDPGYIELIVTDPMAVVPAAPTDPIVLRYRSSRPTFGFAFGDAITVRGLEANPAASCTVAPAGRAQLTPAFDGAYSLTITAVFDFTAASPLRGVAITCTNLKSVGGGFSGLTVSAGASVYEVNGNPAALSVAFSPIVKMSTIPPLRPVLATDSASGLPLLPLENAHRHRPLYVTCPAAVTFIGLKQANGAVTTLATNFTAVETLTLNAGAATGLIFFTRTADQACTILAAGQSRIELKPVPALPFEAAVSVLDDTITIAPLAAVGFFGASDALIFTGIAAAPGCGTTAAGVRVGYTGGELLITYEEDGPLYAPAGPIVIKCATNIARVAAMRLRVQAMNGAEFSPNLGAQGPVVFTAVATPFVDTYIDASAELPALAQLGLAGIAVPESFRHTSVTVSCSACIDAVALATTAGTVSTAELAVCIGTAPFVTELALGSVGSISFLTRATGVTCTVLNAATGARLVLTPVPAAPAAAGIVKLASQAITIDVPVAAALLSSDAITLSTFAADPACTVAAGAATATFAAGTLTVTPARAGILSAVAPVQTQSAIVLTCTGTSLLAAGALTSPQVNVGGGAWVGMNTRTPGTAPIVFVSEAHSAAGADAVVAPHPELEGLPVVQLPASLQHSTVVLSCSAVVSTVGVLHADGSFVSHALTNWALGTYQRYPLALGAATGLVFFTRNPALECHILDDSLTPAVSVFDVPSIPLAFDAVLTVGTTNSDAFTVTITPRGRFGFIDAGDAFTLAGIADATKVTAHGGFTAAPAATASTVTFTVTAAQLPGTELTLTGASAFARTTAATLRYVSLSGAAFALALDGPATWGSVFKLHHLPALTLLPTKTQLAGDWLLSYGLDSTVKGTFPLFELHLSATKPSGNAALAPFTLSFPPSSADALLRFPSDMPVYCEGVAVACTVDAAAATITIAVAQDQPDSTKTLVVRVFGAQLAGKTAHLLRTPAGPAVPVTLDYVLLEPSEATELAVDRSTFPVPAYPIPLKAAGTKLALICPVADLTTVGLVLHDGSLVTKPAAPEATAFSSLFPASRPAVTFVDVSTAKAFVLFSHTPRTCAVRFVQDKDVFAAAPDTTSYSLFVVEHFRSAVVTVTNTDVAAAASKAQVGSDVVTFTVAPRLPYTYYAKGDSLRFSALITGDDAARCAASLPGVTAAASAAGVAVSFAVNTLPGEALTVTCSGLTVAAAAPTALSVTVRTPGSADLTFSAREHADSLFTLDLGALTAAAPAPRTTPGAVFGLSLDEPYADTVTRLVFTITGLGSKVTTGESVTVTFPDAYSPLARAAAALTGSASVTCAAAAPGAVVRLSLLLTSTGSGADAGAGAGAAVGLHFAVVQGFLLGRNDRIVCAPVATAAGVFAGPGALPMASAAVLTPSAAGLRARIVTEWDVPLPALRLLPDAIDLAATPGVIAPAGANAVNFIAGAASTVRFSFPAVPAALPAGSLLSLVGALPSWISTAGDEPVVCAVSVAASPAYAAALAPAAVMLAPTAPGAPAKGYTLTVAVGAVGVPASAAGLVVTCAGLTAPRQYVPASAAATFTVRVTAHFAAAAGFGSRTYTLAKGVLSSAPVVGSGAVSVTYDVAAVGEAGKLKLRFGSLAVLAPTSWLWGSLTDGYKADQISRPGAELFFTVALPRSVKPWAAGFTCGMDPYSIPLPGVTVTLAAVDAAANAFSFKTTGPVDGDGLTVVCTDVVAASDRATAAAGEAPTAVAEVQVVAAVTARLASGATTVFEATHTSVAALGAFEPVGAAEIGAAFAALGTVAQPSNFAVTLTLPRFLAVETGDEVSLALGPSAPVAAASATVTCSITGAADGGYALSTEWLQAQRVIRATVSAAPPFAAAAGAKLTLSCTGLVNRGAAFGADPRSYATLRLRTAAGANVIVADRVPLTAVTPTAFLAELYPGTPIANTAAADDKLSYYVESAPATEAAAGADAASAVTVKLSSLPRAVEAGDELHIRLPAHYGYDYTDAARLAVPCFDAAAPAADAAASVAWARVAVTAPDTIVTDGLGDIHGELLDAPITKTLKLAFTSAVAAPTLAARATLVCYGLRAPERVRLLPASTTGAIYTAAAELVAESTSVVLGAIGIPSIGSAYAYLQPTVAVAGTEAATELTLTVAPLSVAVPVGASLRIELPASVTFPDAAALTCVALRWEKRVSRLNAALPSAEEAAKGAHYVQVTFRSAVAAFSPDPFRVRCQGARVASVAAPASLQRIYVYAPSGEPIAQIPAVETAAIIAADTAAATPLLTQVVFFSTDAALDRAEINLIRDAYRRLVPGIVWEDVTIRSQRLVLPSSAPAAATSADAESENEAALDTAAQSIAPAHTQIEVSFSLSASKTAGELKEFLTANADRVNAELSRVTSRAVIGSSALTAAELPAHCSDGVENDDETDVDCGGGAESGCNACSIDEHCVSDADCNTLTCRDGTCRHSNGALAAAVLSAAAAALVAVACLTVGF